METEPFCKLPLKPMAGREAPRFIPEEESWHGCKGRLAVDSLQVPAVWQKVDQNWLIYSLFFGVETYISMPIIIYSSLVGESTRALYGIEERRYKASSWQTIGCPSTLWKSCRPLHGISGWLWGQIAEVLREEKMKERDYQVPLWAFTSQHMWHRAFALFR